MKGLPTKQRMTLELRIYEELAFRDIAVALGISEGAAKVNFHYAVRKLRSTLAPADGDSQRGKEGETNDEDHGRRTKLSAVPARVGSPGRRAPTSAATRSSASTCGSCMACYRALSELRDAPRIAAMLRADAGGPRPRDESFWDQLAARTGDAAAAAMARAGKRRPLRVAGGGDRAGGGRGVMLFLRARGPGDDGGSPDVSRGRGWR